MKIIHLIWSFNIGGAETMLANIASEQAQMGEDVSLIIINDDYDDGLDSTLAFPRAMTLGALDEKYDSLIFQMGEEIARQCKRLGIHLNYAPVVDVNNNKNNPVINFRSFGEDKEKVVRKSWMYLSGMQSQGVWGCLKHFPGHGDTDVDSHLALPIIRKNKEQLLDLELYPYKKLFANEVNMVMISPLNVPALDNETNSIALISKPIITNLLKNEMGYKGLVITDGMEMEGLRKHFPTDGEAEIRALIAGNDILLLPDQLTIVIPAIKKAIEEGRITEQQINEKCLRVLTMKEKMGIHQNSPLSTHNLYKHFNNYNAKRIIAEIERHALTPTSVISTTFNCPYWHIWDSEKNAAVLKVFWCSVLK